MSGADGVRPRGPAAGPAPEGEVAAVGVERPPGRHGVRCFSHEAMATVFEVFVVHTDQRYAAQAAQAAFDLADRLERELSRFVANSDISRINRLAEGESTRVAPWTLECLAVARHIFDLTGGAFDISLGSGLPHLELDRDEMVVRAHRGGVQLDLGGIGKGYAVDLMAEALEEWGLSAALVHAGFSSVLALEPPPGTGGWPLTLTDPHAPSRVLARLSVRQTALGASGLRKGDHILEPRRTGAAARPRPAAWVALPRPGSSGMDAAVEERPRAAAVADALATAFMLLATDEIEALRAISPGLQAWVLPWTAPTMHELQAPAPARVNPLLTPSPLPYGAPPFDRIQDDDFRPAFEAGMKQQLDEVAAIAANPEPPTFENTLAALERSGQLLGRVTLVFNGLASANTNPTLQALQEEVAPKLAAQDDAIFLDGRLFERVEAVYERRDEIGLQGQSLRLAEYYFRRFVRAGARLSDADKTALKALNEEDAALSAKFANMLLAAAKAAALETADVGDLAGLSKDEIEAAAEAAKGRGLEGRWLVPLQNTTRQPALASLSSRATRERLFHASWTRTERGDASDTRATIARLAVLRARRAALLGHASHAAWGLEDQMAGTPAAVERFLGRLVPPAMTNAREEAREIQALIDRQAGGFALAPWDWDFYAEQVSKARYDLNNADLAPYFSLDRVLRDGVFYAAHELFGITLKERRDLPVYHPDVSVFEVFDRDGTPLALFYCDYFKRDNKNGGAWMDNFAQQSKLLGGKPVVVNVANFRGPAPGQPALLTFDEVGTLFHEFGHALHAIFADSEYPTLSGANVARDFVELPSQINEHWALDPKVLTRYAVHYRTGKPMPPDLSDKIREAATFNQGYALTELLGSAALDLAWHSLPAGSPAMDPGAFEASALEKAGIDASVVPPRYRSSYFLHIWANGYDAGYYAYLWAEMLDNDAFQWFVENGGLTRANGDRFREMILSRGNVSDYAKLYREFRGKDPSIEPMLKRRGILR